MPEVEKEMEAGREMDALVAEKVMGYRVRFEKGEPCGWNVNPDGTTGGPSIWFPNDYVVLGEDDRPKTVLSLYARVHFTVQRVPEYSTNIAAAWQVALKMRELNFSFDAGSWENMDDGNNWEVQFEHCSELIGKKGHAATFELAICRAAIKAIESL